MSGGFAAERNPSKMIFGFNTDIRAQGTVYHVQTEVREQEQRLESQVFVSGRCIGKRSAALPAEPDEEAIQELARAQHRWVVEAVRDGFVDDVLNQETAEELVVQFLGSERVSDEGVMLRFRVLSGGYVAGSAEVGGMLEDRVGLRSAGKHPHERGGVAEMPLALTDGTAELEVRARWRAGKRTRRFLVKSAKV